MSKGGRYERKYARILSEWVTNGEDDTQLIRSKQSGGWSRKKHRQAGDLAANGERGRELRDVFVVEIKARDEFEFRHIWSSEKPALLDWWRQVNKEAEEYHLIPLLIYSKPYHPDLVGLPVEFASPLFHEINSVMVDWQEKEPSIVLFELSDFLIRDPDEILNRGREYLDLRR